MAKWSQNLKGVTDFYFLPRPFEKKAILHHIMAEGMNIKWPECNSGYGDLRGDTHS